MPDLTQLLTDLHSALEAFEPDRWELHSAGRLTFWGDESALLDVLQARGAKVSDWYGDEPQRDARLKFGTLTLFVIESREDFEGRTA
jgi:hypothetical protein